MGEIAEEGSTRNGANATMILSSDAAVAQAVERQIVVLDAAGSNPASRPILSLQSRGIYLELLFLPELWHWQSPV